MTTQEQFEKFQGEFLKFDRVVNKRSNRRDLHAFLMIDEKYPSHSTIVESAEDSEIFIGIPSEETFTDDEVIELIRCGVRWEESVGFCMFV